MKKRVIVWFRRDLRLADNPALSAALERHELLADANGAPATDEQSETIRGMLLDAIAERGGLPSQRAQDLAAARQRAAQRSRRRDAPHQPGAVSG